MTMGEPAVTATSFTSNCAKPRAKTCTIYLPGASGFNSKTPSRLVVVVLDGPSAGRTATVAPGTAAPEGSVTWPRKLPVGTCDASARKIVNQARSDTTSFEVRLNAKFIESPQKSWSTEKTQLPEGSPPPRLQGARIMS